MTKSRRNVMLCLVVGALMPIGSAPALAQTGSGSSDDVYAEDVYEDGGKSYDQNRNAIGLGIGIVQPNDDVNGSNGEIYLALNYRWRLLGNGRRNDGDKQDADYNERYNKRHVRGHYPGRQGGETGGIRGYIEPEISYWKESEKGSSVDDLALGVNLVGVVPTRGADFFLGVGVAAHQLNGDLVRRDSQGREVDRVKVDDNRLGANVHVGVELHVSENFGVFGSGRLDILQDKPFDRQTKIWGGLRFHF
ncbi:MAG TPA: hypothetical protein PK413_17825 [Thermoanaerobaculia bacterium]|nr:hypothetical protein [Thermoanaerobaculia bacterium]